jgi:regulator of protease activity HflC (stomatin/prohibitin superfamily)
MTAYGAVRPQTWIGATAPCYLGAGCLRLRMPVPFQQMVPTSLRTVTMQIPSQKIITKDNVSIDIAAVAYYHITKPANAVIAIENVCNAINQISQTEKNSTIIFPAQFMTTVQEAVALLSRNSASK